MREYNPKRPLERLHRIDSLHYWRYPNLLRDESGRILSDHIMYYKPEDARAVHTLINKVEVHITKLKSDIELAFQTTSGNRWIFLVSSGTLHRKNLDQLQQTYEKTVQFTG